MNDFEDRLRVTTAWVEAHGSGLVGQPLAEVESAVVGAGLVPRVRRRGVQYTKPGRADRVRILVDEQNIVLRVRAG